MESGRRHGWLVDEALSDNPAVGPRPSKAVAGKEGEAGDAKVHRRCSPTPPADAAAGRRQAGLSDRAYKTRASLRSAPATQRLPTADSLFLCGPPC